MCGINGIFAYGDRASRVDVRELIETRDTMFRRGPDGAGEWHSADGRVGLAHRRLSFLDLSEAGAQPMAILDRALWITFNGEIYNYLAIRERLQSKGVVFRGHSDTEVLLHLYAEKGAAMVDDIRGMYAFAIWDDRTKSLFLARDPFGIKPLYLADDGQTIRFASQVKALVRAPSIDTAPDAAAQVGFMLYGSIPDPHTLYAGIRSVPAGSWMRIASDGHKTYRTFCRISDELAAADSRTEAISHDAYRDRLRSELLNSVRRHLISDVPVGVFLSSGLDSSTLTGLAAEVNVTDLHTVTLGFEEYRGSDNDETPLAALVADTYKTTHQTRWVTKKDFDTDYQGLIAAMDQPSIDGVNTYFVSKVSKEVGLKAVLSGLGADELFGGYETFLQIPQMVKIGRKLPSAVVGKALRVISAPLLKHFTSPKYAGLLEYGSTYGGAYLLRRALFMPWELPELLDGDVAKEGWRELQPLMELEATVKGISNPHLRVSSLEMNWYMRNQLLRDSDWAGMAHSLEVRVPFVDLDLLRSVASPASQQPGKAAMAQTPARPLPVAVLNRSKTGFNIPMREWLPQTGSGNSARRLRGWAMQLAREFGFIRASPHLTSSRTNLIEEPLQ